MNSVWHCLYVSVLQELPCLLLPTCWRDARIENCSRTLWAVRIPLFVSGLWPSVVYFLNNPCLFSLDKLRKLSWNCAILNDQLSMLCGKNGVMCKRSQIICGKFPIRHTSECVMIYYFLFYHLLCSSYGPQWGGEGYCHAPSPLQQPLSSVCKDKLLVHYLHKLYKLEKVMWLT